MCGANLNSVLRTCVPRVFHLALLLLLRPPPLLCAAAGFHLLQRSNYETDLAETCRRHNVSLLAYSPLAGELLTALLAWQQPPRTLVPWFPCGGVASQASCMRVAGVQVKAEPLVVCLGFVARCAVSRSAQVLSVCLSVCVSRATRWCAEWQVPDRQPRPQGAFQPVQGIHGALQQEPGACGNRGVCQDRTEVRPHTHTAGAGVVQVGVLVQQLWGGGAGCACVVGLTKGTRGCLRRLQDRLQPAC